MGQNTFDNLVVAQMVNKLLAFIDLKVRHCVYKALTLDRILHPINPVHTHNLFPWDPL